MYFNLLQLSKKKILIILFTRPIRREAQGHEQENKALSYYLSKNDLRLSCHTDALYKLGK